MIVPSATSLPGYTVTKGTPPSHRYARSQQRSQVAGLLSGAEQQNVRSLNASCATNRNRSCTPLPTRDQYVIRHSAAFHSSVSTDALSLRQAASPRQKLLNE